MIVGIALRLQVPEDDAIELARTALEALEAPPIQIVRPPQSDTLRIQAATLAKLFACPKSR